MIHPHHIPILEYDDSPAAVIPPDHEGLELNLPEKVVFAFLGSRPELWAKAAGGRLVGHFISITKKFPVYVVDYKGQQIGLCQAPAGAAAAVQILDWLIAYGARTILSAGSCGALAPLPENAFLLPERALRDEGASYHYLPPSRFVELDEGMLSDLERGLTRLGLTCARCVTWSTDGFYRETRDMVAHRMAEGCTVVDMECSALASCAQFRGARFGQLLFTADSLADLDHYDQRSLGAEAFDKALWLCLELIAGL